MAKKNYDDEDFLKLKQIEEDIAKSAKLTIKSINAWRYFILWCSSFKDGLIPGKGDANHYLNAQQSAEFAFSYDPDQNSSVFVLLAQNKIYECLCDIGIKCAIVESDGIVLVLKNLDINGLFISGVSIKIQCSIALGEKLNRIKKNCSEFQLGEIVGKYDTTQDSIGWSVKNIFDANFPIVNDLAGAKLI